MTIDYSKAYQCVYKVQKERDVFYPLDVEKLVSSYDIRMIPYGKFAWRHGLHIEDVCDLFGSKHGILVRDTKSDRSIIYYNNTLPKNTIRFTLAHELGHYLMGHTCDSKENENIVNCFARNLLAPPAVCHAMGFKTPNSLVSYFGISDKAAEMRIDFLDTDTWYFNKKLHIPNLRLEYCPF